MSIDHVEDSIADLIEAFVADSYYNQPSEWRDTVAEYIYRKTIAAFHRAIDQEFP